MDREPTSLDQHRAVAGCRWRYGTYVENRLQRCAAMCNDGMRRGQRMRDRLPPSRRIVRQPQLPSLSIYCARAGRRAGLHKH
jgi:hypothetical protein